MKRVATVIAPLAAGLLIVPSFHLAISDILLFRSDAASLTIYLTFAGLVVGAVLLAGLLLASLGAGLRASRHQLATALLALACCAGLITAGATLLDTAPGGLDRLLAGTARAAGAWFLALSVLVVLILAAPLYLLILRLMARQAELAGRLDKLGLLVVGIALAGSVTAWLSQSYSAPLPAADAGSRHLVLLVLDRMPSWALSSYRSGAEPTVLDTDLRDRMRVFHNMQTTYPYTHSFFGSLYNGRLPGDPSISSLLHRLDEHGVAVTLMSGHRNVTPEGSAARMSNYRGLRSRLLGPNSAALPRLLGMPYHLNISEPGWNEGVFLRAFWLLLNPDQPTPDALEQILLPAVEDNAARFAQSFTMFHLSISRFNPVAHAERSPQYDTDDASALIAAARNNDYRYEPSPENDAVIRQHYGFVTDDVKRFAERFKTFLTSLHRSPALRDAAIIITSDHGSIYDKGRIFYGYHPQREVVRVPFLVFGNRLSGEDHRLLGTLDLSHSVLDYFGAAEPALAPDAISLLGDGEREETASLTMRSSHQKEWFLVIFRGENAYRLNLHPDVETSIEAVRYDEFDEIALPVDTDLEQDLMSAARHWLSRFDVRLADTNLAGE